MGIDPLSFRQIEQQTEDIYEAIVVMSQRARQILHDRIVERVMKDDHTDDLGVFDEMPEIDPESYVEKEKPTRVAVQEFLEGNVNWTVHEPEEE